MAPGLRDDKLSYQAAHTLNLAHGKAVQVFRQGGHRGKIGIVLDLHGMVPASNAEKDVLACQRTKENAQGIFFEPIFHGRYPSCLMEWLGPLAPEVAPGDLSLINQPLDFLGLNYYFTQEISEAVDGGLLKASRKKLSPDQWGNQDKSPGGLLNSALKMLSVPGAEATAVGWGVYPSGLSRVLKDVAAATGNLPVYITENGCATNDIPGADGFVEDHARIDYLRRHLLEVHSAIRNGVDVRGYFVWSLMDNFEWSLGYRPRFGIVRVDYETLRRTPKLSARWYRDVIARNGLEE
jgi:beta-glucosidase